MNPAFPSQPIADITANTQTKPPSTPASLITDDTVRYVVVPAMVGGLGSVALQMIQDGGNFVVTPDEQTTKTAHQDNNESAILTDQTSRNEGIKTTSEQSHEHDFIPAIKMHTGVEFSILVASSVLLGAVVGYIGAILTTDGQPRESNNKPKLAATALMFALFFPSVIQVLEKNVESEANKIRSELQDNVQEANQVAETNAQLTKEKEKAAKDNIDQTNQNLDEVAESFKQVDAANFTQNLQIKETTKRIIESKFALIDEAKSLALEATSDESAKQFVNSIFEIGRGDDVDVKQHAIQVLAKIKEESGSREVQEAAEAKAAALRNLGDNNAV
ncbi:hypothetical protein [Leptothoe spongobia]|uniref:Uncharacterized protein n=1 Tax=Leptothoe spongobia TAU-MAC 1115 TaxID=1967444 RepID=A0A947GI00_9CYAN|nr:hypothetical protein [Leptothoe spongobia]MBT9315324.1 hypothetical protein [Leptothoe spongobia TAU-MAC 1115]